MDDVTDTRQISRLEIVDMGRPASMVGGGMPLGAEYVAMIRGAAPCICWAFTHYRWEIMDYHYLEHPQLYDFCRGVTAHPSAPEHVRDGPELLAEFPPKALPKLCGRLFWFGESFLIG